MTVSPRATSPANTRLAEARKSVAITIAPSKYATPFTSAVLPSMLISAPRRCISCTCIKRFSKIVSVTFATPTATLFSAINCACISVGKAGCGAVRILTAFNFPSLFTVMVFSTLLTFTSAPASRNFSITASNKSARALCSLTSPPVIAAATM